jgi:hypothetical protein
VSDYLFFGKVLPERANVTIDGLPPMNFALRDIGAGIEVTLSVTASQITAGVSIAAEGVDLMTLRNYIDSIVRAHLDMVGYLWAHGYEVEITGVRSPDGGVVVFGVDIPELDRGERPLDVNQVFNVLWTAEPYLRRRCAGWST